MRFLRLDLLAFGPFTDTSLDLSGPGLHVIYGPNEAGKTTARRALRMALFGFPHKVEFDFLHDKAALRVGLTVEDREGRRTSFIRRRGNKNDLLDANDQTPFDTDPVAPLLASAGLVGDRREQHFETAFAIGEAELRAGGQEILAGKGDLSELLFMTAAGLPRLRAVERELLDAADKLFLPTGKKPPINEALLRWKELQAESQQKSLPPAEFLQHTAALQEATACRDRIEARLTELRRREAQLTRLTHAIRPAARLRERERELTLVADAPLLPEGFAETRRRLEADQQVVTARLESLENELRQIEMKLEELDVPEDLLASSQEIERLYKRLGSYELTLADVPKRFAELNHVESAARAALRDIRPDLTLADAGTLRLTRQERAGITELGRRRSELLATQRQIEERRRKLLDESKRANDALQRLGVEPPLQRLRAACQQISRQQDLDSALAEARSDSARLCRQVSQTCTRLTGWEGPAEDADPLPVPSAATIDRFESQFAALASEAARLAERRADAEQALTDAEQSLIRLVRDGDVPTEEALRAARERRDALWNDIRIAITDAAQRPVIELLPHAEAVATRFESAKSVADDAADRLRREASRAQQLLSLSDEKERRTQAIDRLAAAAADLERREQQLAAEWKLAWPFLSDGPRTPREMRDWRLRWEELLRLIEQQRTAMLREEALAAQHDELRRQLVAALSEASGKPLDDAIPIPQLAGDAQSLLASGEEDAKRRSQSRTILERAQTELADIETSLASNHAELENAEDLWSERMKALGLATDASAEMAEAFLVTTAEIFDQLGQAETLCDRLAQMNEHGREFEADVRAAVARLAPDLIEKAPASAVNQLKERLVEAQMRRDRRRNLQDDQEKKEAERATAQRRAGEIGAELAVLCRDAGCEDAAELPRIEARSDRRRQLEAHIAEANDELRSQSGGRPIEAFLAEIDEIDIDAIPPELQRIEQQIAALDAERQQAAANIGRHEQALSAMKGDAAAADALEEAESVLAKLAGDVERYIRLRLAARLLREGRERYRRKSGSEVLDDASGLFSQLTCGAFEGLRVDFGENDEPTLFGIRATGGAAVRPDGMSDGTADQLYLALRLAGLNAWLDRHEPIPFVVDDLLIHFDDRRASAALTVLAELSTRTQVLFFTHHEHLARLASEAVPSNVLHLHDLMSLRKAPSSDNNGRPIAEPKKQRRGAKAQKELKIGD